MVVAFLLEVVRAHRGGRNAEFCALDVFALKTGRASCAGTTAVENTQLAAAADRCAGCFQTATTGSCCAIGVCVAGGGAITRFRVGLQADVGFFAAFVLLCSRGFAHAAVQHVAGGIFRPAHFACGLQIAAEGFSGAVGVCCTGTETSGVGGAACTQIHALRTGHLALVALAVALGQFDTDTATEVDAT